MGDMMTMLRTALGAILLVDAVAANAIVLPPLPTSELALAPRTQIMLTNRQGLPRNTLRRGDRFDVVVADDIIIGDFVIIPRGAPGHGIVTERIGIGSIGTLEFDLTDILVDGRPVPVVGHYRIEAAGNTTPVVPTWAVAGVVAPALVTGRSASAEPAETFFSFTTIPIPLSLPDYAVALGIRSGDRQRLVGADAPPLRQAASPSGYCYEVPASYGGTGSARFPVLTRQTPACRDLPRGG